MAEPHDNDHAFILSGGGAYGAYEVGVMQALCNGEAAFNGYRALDPKIFTGTSVGAFNASVMVMGRYRHSAEAADQLTRFWLDDVADNGRNCGNGVYYFRGNPSRLLDPNCFANPAASLAGFGDDALFYARSLARRGVEFFEASGDIVTRALQFVDLGALISVEPFKRTLRETVALEDIRRSDRELRIVATNFDTGEVRTFENRDMSDEYGHEIIRASAAVPGIFPPVELAGDLYVDGGVVMNTPLSCAIAAGATTLYVVYMDPDPKNIPNERIMNTLDTIDRVFTIALATKTNEDIDTAAWINQGLETVRKSQGGEGMTDADMIAFIRVARQIKMRLEQGAPYKPLTIHRFHPEDDLGGSLGMLNFGLEAVTRLIERGYWDAVNHNCSESDCIFPDTPPPAKKGRR